MYTCSEDRRDKEGLRSRRLEIRDGGKEDREQGMNIWKDGRLGKRADKFKNKNDLGTESEGKERFGEEAKCLR